MTSSLQYTFLLRRYDIFLCQIKMECLPFIKEHHQSILLLANPGLTFKLSPLGQSVCWNTAISSIRMKSLFLAWASVLTANLYLLSCSWDESSSISSGLSDASDNLSSEEFNASSSLNSLPTTPTASRRNSTIVVRELTNTWATVSR